MSIKWCTLSLSPLAGGLLLSDTHKGVLTPPSPPLTAGLGVIVLAQEFVPAQLKWGGLFQDHK